MLPDEWTFVCLERRRNFSKSICGKKERAEAQLLLGTRAGRGVCPGPVSQSPGLNLRPVLVLDHLLQDGRQLLPAPSNFYNLSKSKLIFSSEVKMVAR